MTHINVTNKTTIDIPPVYIRHGLGILAIVTVYIQDNELLNTVANRLYVANSILEKIQQENLLEKLVGRNLYDFTTRFMEYLPEYPMVTIGEYKELLQDVYLNYTYGKELTECTVNLKLANRLENTPWFTSLLYNSTRLEFGYTSVNARKGYLHSEYRLLNSKVSVVNKSLLKASLTLYRGTYAKGVDIEIPPTNSMYKVIKHVTNLPYIYGNMLLDRIQGFNVNSIKHYSSYKKLYNILYKMLIKTGDPTLQKTYREIMDNVSKEIYNRIVDFGSIPTKYNPKNTEYPITITQLQYGVLETDIGAIVNIDTHWEAKSYLDYKHATIKRDKDKVWIHIPNLSLIHI